MNQITNSGEKGLEIKSEEIKIVVCVNSKTCTFDFSITIYNFTPFEIFQEFIKQQIFAESDSYFQKCKLVYKFGNKYIKEKCYTSLAELGFVDNSQLNLQIDFLESESPELTILVKVQAQQDVIHLTLTSFSFIPFSKFQEIVKEEIFSKFSRNDYENTFRYEFGKKQIEEKECQGLGQLGFKKNSELQVFLQLRSRQPFNIYKFRIISKLSTFSFELHCHLDMSPDQFEETVKQRIFEISGLIGNNIASIQANQDYVDKLIFQSQSTFCPFKKNNRDHFILNFMQKNIIFDVILEPINRLIDQQ